MEIEIVLIFTTLMTLSRVLQHAQHVCELHTPVILQIRLMCVSHASAAAGAAFFEGVGSILRVGSINAANTSSVTFALR